MKLPNHAAKELFYKIVRHCEQVKSGHNFIHRGKCPLCGDHKKRMYLREYTQFHLVYCHNCGYSHQLTVFIKEHYPEEIPFIKSFLLSSVRDGSAFKKTVTVKTEKNNPYISYQLNDYVKKFAFNICVPQENVRKEKYRMLCQKYLTDRKIPLEVSNDFYCIFGGPLAGYIGIPFFDETKKYLLHIQGRLVLPDKKQSQQKYMFLKDVDNGIELDGKEIWGQWRVNPSDNIIICEGTLDAAAFEKGIATCGATISESFIHSLRKKYKNRIWCVDNYWTDIAGQDLTNRLLKLGEVCFIIPRSYTNCKDANDLVKLFNQQYIPLDFINENTYQGNLGLLKLKSEIAYN